MTISMPETLTPEERDRAIKIITDRGGTIEIGDLTLTEEDSIALAMYVLGMRRSKAMDYVAIARGKVSGDVVEIENDTDSGG